MSELTETGADTDTTVDDAATDFSDMLAIQAEMSALTLKYTLASNMLAAQHSTQKSMCEKIGQM